MCYSTVLSIDEGALNDETIHTDKSQMTDNAGWDQPHIVVSFCHTDRITSNQNPPRSWNSDQCVFFICIEK